MAQRDTSLGHGVYYDTNDYVGILRRVLIHVIDLAVLLFVGFVAFQMVLNFIPERAGTVFWSWLGFAYLYLTLLKSSPIRTLGYRLTGSQIVNLRGTRPSVLWMTFRLALWIRGPFSFLFDLLWAGIDEDRQTLRDRFAGTCVINAGATPLGEGEVHLAVFSAAGFNLMYPKVMRPTKPAPGRGPR